MSTPAPQYTTGKVTSADGTTIGYRRLGNGAGVVLLGAGYLAAQHYMGLGRPEGSEGVCRAGAS